MEKRFCAICAFDISNKRSNAETCSPACKKKHQRTKNKTATVEPKKISKHAAYRLRHTEKVYAYETNRNFLVRELSGKLTGFYHGSKSEEERVELIFNSISLALGNSKDADNIEQNSSLYKRMFRNPVYNNGLGGNAIKTEKGNKVFATIVDEFCQRRYGVSIYAILKSKVNPADQKEDDEMEDIQQPLEALPEAHDADAGAETAEAGDKPSWMNWGDDEAGDLMELGDNPFLRPDDEEEAPAALIERTATEGIDEYYHRKSLQMPPETIDSTYSDEVNFEDIYGV